jgi:BirA family transcriptional regulator, biotin operon repressor / biotin---[acetyl-CoA-carboxylase] ligase
MIIGSKIIYSESLPSTNTYAAELLQGEELPDGTIIHTGYQTAGRGHKASKWESESGKNLLFSIVLRPDMIMPSEQFLISMTLSLGVCDFIRRFIPDCTVKWPNDIYVKNDKIAGILVENQLTGNRIDSTIAGIGININQEKFRSDAPNPVSLTMLTGRKHDLKECLDLAAHDLDSRYKQLLKEDFDGIRDEYISRLFRLNEWSGYRDNTGMFRGRIKTIGVNGMLRIERSSGDLSEYSYKEVEFIL